MRLKQSIVFSKAELPNAFAAVPLTALRLEAGQLAALDSIGMRSVGDCLRLPRGGLGRRTSPKLIEVFEHLTGRLPDPRPRFELPKVFQSSLELPWETVNAQALSTAGERLLHELSGYLRGRASMARSLRWSLGYNDNQVVHFQLELTRPSRKQSHFALLLREHLSRIQLQAPVRKLALYVDNITPDEAYNGDDLFKRQREGTHEDWSSFLDRLRARLGEQAVRGSGPSPPRRERYRRGSLRAPRPHPPGSSA